METGESTKQGLVVGYVRVSTDRQAKEGHSLKAQDASIRAYAKAHGVKVDRIYRESGASGKDTERPELARLRSDLENIGVVIVYKFDRISRSVVDLYGLLEEFQAVGVAFQSVSEGIDTGSAIGEFIIGIMAALAQMERKLIGERTKATLSKIKADGKHLGKCPYGYRRKPDGFLEKNPDQQLTIARIKRLGRSGASQRSIASQTGVPRSTVGLLLKSNGNSRNARFVNGIQVAGGQ